MGSEMARCSPYGNAEATRPTKRFGGPAGSYTYNGVSYPYGYSFTMQPTRKKQVDPTYAGYAAWPTSVGVVFALMLAKASLFSEARFQWRQFRNGRPGPLFGNTELEALEAPWPNATTGDLLSRLIQGLRPDRATSTGGRTGDGLTPLRPDWVTIVVGSNMDTDNPAAADRRSGRGLHLPPRRAQLRRRPHRSTCRGGLSLHRAPPTRSRGSGDNPLTSILQEVMADEAATAHKLKFFEGGATPNLAVSVDLPDPDDFFEFVKRYREEGEGVANAYKTLFFNTGTTFQTVGTDLRQLDFKVTQGAGETRIASAAGVPQ